jgi:regulator of protease activity HflC (stomatin/prohibitin superfamily)
MITTIICGIGVGALAFSLLSAFKIVRPTERAIVERLGKYNRFVETGLTFVIPLFERIVKVNITEQMINAEPQEIITQDKLNATVDAQIYFKVKATEQGVKDSQYNVNDCKYQIINLARTTLRNLIGTMNLNDANSKRDEINSKLMAALSKETKSWGIEVVRTELKEINPPKDVQETMNSVVKAENTKTAAVDFATATETEADGTKRAAIKAAEGAGKAITIKAEAEAEAITVTATAQAEAIKLVNESAEKYFKGNAQALKKLEVTQASLKDNAKIIIAQDTEKLQLLIGNIN